MELVNKVWYLRLLLERHKNNDEYLIELYKKFKKIKIII